MAAKGSGNSKNTARTPAKKSPAAAKRKDAAPKPQKNASKPVNASAPAKPGNSKPPETKEPVKKALNKTNGKPPAPEKKKKIKWDEAPPEAAPEIQPDETGVPSIQEKLLILKRKMHLEIFERCVAKHFFSNINEWEEITVDDDEIIDEDDVLDDPDD